MMGKGSVNHNNRKFIADNVDENRTANNIVFCNEDIKKVYHQLFSEALNNYNDKQARNDRKIPDYYEKIRTSKQEKLFHEVIFQIGNKDDMNTRDENGQLSKTILSEFMNDFQKRNPHLKVFGSYLHMDEETPHLHIDVIPFTTGSKRGLETRVSLKKALAQQGFTGNSRSETEWNKWVQAEKEELSAVMEKYGILWKKLDTHNPHLSVLDYKKQERTKEVKELEKEIEHINSDIEHFTLNTEEYDTDPKWQVPSPQPMMSANKYKEALIVPFVKKLKAVIKSVVHAYVKLMKKYRGLENRFNKLKKENSVLSNMAATAVKDYKAVSNELKEQTGKSEMRETDYMEIVKNMNHER